MELNSKEVFKIYYQALRLSHLHPDTKRDIKWIFIFISKQSILFILFSLLMYNIIFINLKDRDFSQVCRNASIAVVYLVTSFHHFIIIWKERYLTESIKKITNDYALTKLLPVEEQEIVYKYAKKTINILKLWRFISLIAVSFFPLMNLTLITYYWIIGEFRFIPLYELVYPSFLENIKYNVFIYTLTYLCYLWYGASSSLMFTAFVPIGPSFMLHVCGQLEVLKMRVEVLFKNDNIEEVGKKLNEIVKHLQYIYDFVDFINLSFTVAYEVTLKASTILLPITCFEVLQSIKHGQVSLEFIMFIIAGFTLNSTLCFYSDLVMEKSEELKQAVYSCGWEKVYDRRTRSTVRLILLRAERPMAIRTLFCTMCLHALTELLHQSYLIFNLMNAVWN